MCISPLTWRWEILSGQRYCSFAFFYWRIKWMDVRVDVRARSGVKMRMIHYLAGGWCAIQAHSLFQWNRSNQSFLWTPFNCKYPFVNLLISVKVTFVLLWRSATVVPKLSFSCRLIPWRMLKRHLWVKIVGKAKVYSLYSTHLLMWFLFSTIVVFLENLSPRVVWLLEVASWL